MQTKIAKTLSAISLRVIYSLMILSMLLAGVGVTPAHAATFTISGNAGVAGATITFSGTGGGTTTSDASGNYSKSITVGWWYSGTATPSKAGYTFSPTSKSYSFVTSSQTNQNYTAAAVTYTISGSVGTAGAGATITYNGGSTTANGTTGNYSFTVSGGWTGTVTPSKTGYTFTPANLSYSNVTANQVNQNFTAVLSMPSISGNAGTGGATITYTGGSTTANSSGDYSFTVSSGWSGTVTPSKTGFSFVPGNRAYTNVTTGQAVQNYTARPVAFSFASMGDAQGEVANFSATVNQISTLNPALVIFNGDLEDGGVVSTEMNPMINALKTANLFNNTFLVRGNHDDRVEGSAALWESYFETAPNIKVLPPYVTNKTALDSASDQLNYSFDYGNSIFIGLDVPEDIGVMTQAQLNFLDARLTYAEGQGLTHAFIFFHGPEYPVESTHSYCETRTDDSCTPAGFINVINDHPIVSATFHGHEHILGYTHMDSTRVAGLTRSYEQFITSPSGGWTYNEFLYPERMDYTYMDMESSQGFATLDVNGNSFTFNIYKVGTTQPVYSHTFSKLNTPPTISDITNKTTDEDTATGNISFTVGDAEIQAAYLTVTTTSSNTTLVPNGNISVGGSDGNRTLNITPASNQSGTTTITVSVNDGNVNTSDTFLLTVSAVNDAPIAEAQSISTSWNTSKDITLTGTDVEGSSLTYSIHDNPAHGILSGSGANQIYTPTTGYSGIDTFTFTANDGTVNSLPATVSITVTAHVISGNAGIAGATLSYTVGTPKTVIADGSGMYTFQVPTDWSGTVTPSKAGYAFSPASMSYSNVIADQTAQNYTTTGLTFTISGNAGIAGATLRYTDGTPKTVIADEAGQYSFDVPYNWSGMVTPSLSGYGFIPGTKTYTNVTSNQFAQDYRTTTSRVWYVDKTNAACTDTGQVGSFAVPFCTIGRGAYLATAGQIVHVLHGTYAESVFPTNSGTVGNPITFQGDPGVTVTGTAPGTGFGSAFGVTSKSYIVIDGFNITNTWYKGLYVDSSNHITISNNRVSYAGVTSPTHPYEQGIYLRNTTYSTITGNTTDHNTCIGIRVTTGGYNMISNNVSYSNYSVVESDAAGIELTGSSNNTISNNITYSNEDSGINVYLFDAAPPAVDVQSTYNLVIGNLSYENGDHGIDDNNSPYNTFVGNTVQGNGTVGINVEGEATTGSHHAVVVNNIISGNGFTPPSGSFGGNLRVDTPSVAGTIIDYNLFNKESAMYQIIWNNVNYVSLAAFHVAVPTQEVHGLEGNPLFVAPVPSVLRQTGVNYVGLGILGDYYPKPGSPAIDSANADAPNQSEFDIDGNSRVDDPGTVNTGSGVRTFDDRGAYEFLPLGASLPELTTQAVTGITTTTATGNGNIIAQGEPQLTQHGVVWSTSAVPTTADNKTTDGTVNSTGAFASNITGLIPGTLYHVRAYATNTVGTVYGEEVTFTAHQLSAVTTQAVTNIMTTTATGNGNVTALGVPNPTQHGVVWSTSAAPTLADSKTADGDVSATGAFTSNITGLTPGTLYHVRAYATNNAGTVYGEEVTFTAYQLPTVTTQAVTNITTATATGNGNVTALGVPNPTQHGIVWSTAADPTIADSKTTNGDVSVTGAFTGSMVGLTPGTLYHVRAYATNAASTVYGEDVTFTTLLAPTVVTLAVSNITTTTATGNGNISVLGTFNPTEHGVVWGTGANPTIANNKTTDGPVSATGSFTSSITGLTPGTLYHVRAYATSAAGTSYGEDATFTALIAPTVTTQAVSSIGTTTAIGNGDVTALGVPNPTQHGVVWSTAENPTINDSKTMDGDILNTGAFTSSITGLTPGLLYHVRAYATNTAGVSYGNDVTFTTLPSVTGTTIPATNAGTGAYVPVGGTADWSNPGYITVDDTSYASASLNSPSGILSSSVLQGDNFGFTIPSDAVINGIMVTIGRHESGRGSSVFDVRDSTVKLLKAGTMVGVNKAASGTEWPLTPPAPASYGTPADLWGTVWTPADINDADFGVALSVISDVSRIAYVDYMQISVTYSVTVVGSNTTVNCGAGSPVTTYGSSITCVATVVRGSGTKTPAGNVSWTTNGSGSFVTSPCILSGSDGSATCSVTYTPSSVGSGSHLITATYAGDPNFFSSNGNQIVAVNKKGASVMPSVASKTYGDADPTLVGSLSGFLAVDGVTAVYSRTIGEDVAVSPYTISATLSPTNVLANYNITYGTANFTINPKPITVTVNAGQTKSFGVLDPSFTYTASDTNAIFTGALDREPGVDVGAYAIGQGTLAVVGSNYSTSFISNDFVITAKLITITPDAGQTKVFGTSDPLPFTYTHTALVGTDSISGTLDRLSGEDANTYAYTLGTLAVGTNYTLNIVSSPATFSITPKPVIVTADAGQSKVLGAVDPTLTYTSSDATVSFTGALDREVGEDVGAYAISQGNLEVVGNNYSMSFISNDFTITPPLDEYILSLITGSNGTVVANPSYSHYHYGDVVSLTATANPGWAFENWTGALTGSNNPDSVTIRGNTTVTANYIVVSVAPSFTSTPVTGVDEDVLYTYSITVTDPNVGDILTISAPTKPVWLTLTDNGDGTAILTGTPTNAEVGSHTILLQVSDGTLTTDQSFSVVVTNTNDAPSFTSSAVTSVAEDILYSYNITVGDPDAGAILTISALIKPEWLTLTDNGDGTAILTGTPTNANVGINNVTLRVNDGVVDVDQVFTIDVGNTNDGPSFTSTAVTNADEDALYTYDIIATDPDTGDTLIITAPTIPVWLTLTDNSDGTATLTGTPTNSEVGDNVVVLQVSDSVELASQLFTITVINTNDAPVLAQPAAQNNAKGNVISLQLSATDVDAGNTLTYSATGLPVDLNINSLSGLISGTLTDDADTYNVTISVDDGLGGTDSKSFNWVVTEPVHTLTVNKIGNGTVTPDKAAPYYLNDVVELTAVADAGWTFSAWTGDCAGTGTCSVTMDADKSVTATFTQNEYILTVNKVGSGTITPSIVAPYHLNDVVELTAVADAGWTFSGWTGDCTGAGTCSVTMDADKSVTATFTQIPSMMPGIADDRDALWSYSGSWATYDGAGPYSDTLHYSSTIGDYSQIAINGGQQIKLTYFTASNRGITDVYIDEVKVASIDAYSSNFGWQIKWTSDVLTSGFHIVRLVHASGAYTDIDAIELLATPQISLLPGIADDIDPLWSYSGEWMTYAGAGPSSSTLHYSSAIGDTAQIMIDGGQQIKLTYLTANNRGITDVYVDDVKIASLNAYAPSFNWQVTWTSDVLTSGLHTVRLVHASGAYTDIDAIEVIPASARLLPGTADDHNALWSYSGDWYTYIGGGAYSNTLHYSSTIGDSAQIVIDGGQQIKLTYLKISTWGVMDVYIDGVKVASLDANSPTIRWQETWTSEILTSGLHTVRLVHASGAYAGVDAIEVIATPISLLPGTADDIDPLWSYSGEWMTYAGVGPSSDTLHYSSAVGDTAQIVIDGGQQIKLTYLTADNWGVTDIYVDGVKIASLDANSPFSWQETWTSEILSAGIHTVRLVHVSGAYTSIDAIELIPTSARLLPGGIADDGNTLWSYSGEWITYAGAGPSSDTLHYSNTIGDSAQIVIDGGQQIKLTYLAADNWGITDVYIDGVKIASIDANSPFNWQGTWTSETLTSGLHMVRLVHSSGTYTSIDALEVLP